MTDLDFLNEYEKRIDELVTISIKTIKNMSSLHYLILQQKYEEERNTLRYDINYLIPDIMDKFNLNPNLKVLDGFVSVSLESSLLRKSFSIQVTYYKKFEEGVIKTLQEARCRDFPDYYLKG